MWILGFAAAASAASGCGKKGPPLAPLVRIPAAVEQASARRVGSDVYVTLTVPSANIDQHTPADIARVEVYGYTGPTAPQRGRFAEVGTLVATIPIAPPAAPADEKQPAAEPAEPLGPAQGAQVTIRDRITNTEPRTTNPEPGTTNSNVEPGSRNPELPLRRFYIAYPWSPRGRVGPPGTVVELPLAPLPDPPPSASVEYSEKVLAVTWEPSGGLLAFLLERTVPEEPLPFTVEDDNFASLGTTPVQAVIAAEQGPILYNVYRSSPPDPFAPPQEQPTETKPWAIEPPAPLNPAPLPGLTFTDSVTFGEPRCYTVRAVRGTGPDAAVGNPSPPVCVTAIDTFAPATPSGLATVASEGGISLIWEPNPEPDLGGYLVLRGEAADATLQPLTLTPIAEAAYRDTTVKSGVRYRYAVVAVDNRFPVPNVSAASTPIEETAR